MILNEGLAIILINSYNELSDSELNELEKEIVEGDFDIDVSKLNIKNSNIKLFIFNFIMKKIEIIEEKSISSSNRNILEKTIFSLLLSNETKHLNEYVDRIIDFIYTYDLYEYK